MHRSVNPSRRLIIGGLASAAALPPLTANASSTSAEVWLDGGYGFDRALVAENRFSAEAIEEAVRLSALTGHKALLVWHDGKLLLEHYGDGTDSSSLLPGFSMAKTVLGLMTGLAISKGLVSDLDAPVGRYIDEWQSDPRGEITLRHLMEMRSGLHLYSLARQEPQAMAMVSGPHATATALETPLADTPGASFRYANVNSQILGIAVSRALERSGTTYPAALQDWLWQPLGLGRSRLELESANGYPRFFAGLDARARDWLGLASVFLRDDIVPPQWLDQMAQASPHAPYGLHVWRGQAWAPRRHYGDPAGPSVPVLQPYRLDDMLVWDGAGGQRAYVSRGAGLVIIRMGQASWEWEDSALPNHIIQQLGLG
ncbi:serine hydrolase [uncultured Brevundimonas sp.]|uniref:serine hydrolase domain-containing protein n=1 Tax=uncultured Brevundimonas sp. TaxID=213418 RepID=UPI002633761C|nr:serine hydrolase [uncultured Brevundimonas sp.]